MADSRHTVLGKIHIYAAVNKLRPSDYSLLPAMIPRNKHVATIYFSSRILTSAPSASKHICRPTMPMGRSETRDSKSAFDPVVVQPHLDSSI